MTANKIIGWKNYGVALLWIALGLWSFSRGEWNGAVTAVLFGLFVIALRDVFGKVLSALDANRQTLDDLRAAIETELSTRKGNR